MNKLIGIFLLLVSLTAFAQNQQLNRQLHIFQSLLVKSQLQEQVPEVYHDLWNQRSFDTREIEQTIDPAQKIQKIIELKNAMEVLQTKLAQFEQEAPVRRYILPETESYRTFSQLIDEIRRHLTTETARLNALLPQTRVRERPPLNEVAQTASETLETLQGKVGEEQETVDPESENEAAAPTVSSQNAQEVARPLVRRTRENRRRTQEVQAVLGEQSQCSTLPGHLSRINSLNDEIQAWTLTGDKPHFFLNLNLKLIPRLRSQQAKIRRFQNVVDELLALPEVLKTSQVTQWIQTLQDLIVHYQCREVINRELRSTNRHSRRSRDHQHSSEQVPSRSGARSE